MIATWPHARQGPITNMTSSMATANTAGAFPDSSASCNSKFKGLVLSERESPVHQEVSHHRPALVVLPERHQMDTGLMCGSTATASVRFDYGGVPEMLIFGGIEPARVAF